MTPYLSVVVVARNDNYGGNFLKRFRQFVQCMTESVEARDMSAELIVVEWNPPVDRPELAKAISWPVNRRRLTIRVVQVPPEVHRSHPLGSKLPLLEYLGKSVGIRRAHGRFVLCTNPDILLNGHAFDWLARKDLRPDAFYRMIRWQVKPEIPDGLSLEQQLAFCATHVFSRSYYGTALPVNSSGRICWSIPVLQQYLMRQWLRIRTPIPYDIWTHASGDFLMMATEAWHHLRGYPDIPSFNYLDGYMCFLAVAADLKQIVIKDPMRSYHQDHDCSSRADRPSVGYDEYVALCDRALTASTPTIHNDVDWGLGAIDLPDHVIA